MSRRNPGRWIVKGVVAAAIAPRSRGRRQDFPHDRDVATSRSRSRRAGRRHRATGFRHAVPAERLARGGYVLAGATVAEAAFTVLSTTDPHDRAVHLHRWSGSAHPARGGRRVRAVR